MRLTVSICILALALAMCAMLACPALGQGSINETWIRTLNPSTSAYTTLGRGAAYPLNLFSWNATRSVWSGNYRFEAAGVSDKLMYWCDDFMEAAAALASTVYSKAHWTGGGTSGTQTVTAGVGGTMVLATTSTGSRTSTLTFSTANFSSNYAPVFEARAKANGITTTRMALGWYVDANNYLLFEFDTDDSASVISVVYNNAGGGEVRYPTTVTLGTSYKKYRIEIAADESFRCYIDDSLVYYKAASTIAALATYKPYFYVDNKSTAVDRTLTIDYVKLWQIRE